MSKNVKIIQCQFCGSGSKFNFYIRKKRKEGFVGRFTYRAAFIYTYVCVIMFKIFLVKILTETLEIIIVILRFICISSVHIYIYICTHIYIHTHMYMRHFSFPANSDWESKDIEDSRAFSMTLDSVCGAVLSQALHCQIMPIWLCYTQMLWSGNLLCYILRLMEVCTLIKFTQNSLLIVLGKLVFPIWQN